jgi:hypothetical protein
MTFTEWMSLSENERQDKCQYLDSFEETDVFQGVANAFLKQYGDHPGMDRVDCGLGPFIGPYNSIVVSIKEDEGKTTWPEIFLGFPVIIEKK